MSSRSLNRAQLMGNLTRDPELRYTPAGTAVCSFGLATNRSWMTDSGERKEDVEFHRIVAWAKLAELCAQLLHKGRQVYVEGRLQTRQWTGQDGVARSTTEVVIDDMIVAGDRRSGGEESNMGGVDYDEQSQGGAAYGSGGGYVDDFANDTSNEDVDEKPATKKTATKKPEDKKKTEKEELDKDLPF